MAVPSQPGPRSTLPGCAGLVSHASHEGGPALGEVAALGRGKPWKGGSGRRLPVAPPAAGSKPLIPEEGPTLDPPWNGATCYPLSPPSLPAQR